MRRKSGFLSGLVWGALVGGTLALLYAPKSGEALREDLSEELDRLAERADEYRAVAAERAAEYRDLALERAGEYRDFAVERSAEFYDAASSKTEEIRVNLAQSAQQLKSQFDEFTQGVMGKEDNTALESLEEDTEVVISEFKEALEQQQQEVAADAETTTEA